MAAYINRTVSMIGGDSQLRNDARIENSPLQIFVKAKKKINDIFGEIEDYVQDTVGFMESLRDDRNIVSQEETTNITEYINKVHGIRDVLKRDHMKVAFFGRTSNGKSSVINAMLRNKILPSGMGHTTNCFLQVEGSDNGESYLMIDGSNKKQPVDEVQELGHALSKEKLSESNLVRIFWPKEKCLLLRDDVVFVDSPGVDVTPNLDKWIDEHCLDADVFVLVVNAESTITSTEKNFFHKVSARLSKPNVFILHNRWDLSADSDNIEGVRAQHQERAVEFLAKEMKVYSAKDAEERVFYISAKEALKAREQEQQGQPAHNGALAEGFQNRYFEFQDFERKFEECISKSAVKTKFEQHSLRGKHIATEIRETMDDILNRTQKMRVDQLAVKQEVNRHLNDTEQQLIEVTKEMKKKIHQMVEDVDQRVSKALNEEIRRLGVLVDEFNVPFHSDSLVLNVYKRELHTYLENGLGSNLRARLSTALALNIEESQREMTSRMSDLLPENKKALTLSLMPRREPFEILYRLNCDNICAGFQEDLEFRFSWGITALINRFVGKQGNKLAIANYPQEIPQSLVSPTDSIDSVKFISNPVDFPPKNDDWSLATRIAIASITSQGTMGGLIVAGFMLKTVGWRLIAITGAIYGTLYFYERLTWTNKSKEREFKRQYVAHATQKLKSIVDLISANCSHQVQQELSSTFARLGHLVDEAIEEMDVDLKNIDTTVKTLEVASTNAKVLRNKANYLANELELFDAAYIKSLN